MLLQVIPTAKIPSVLFTLTFPELPFDLPCPAAWNTYMQRLAAEDLELPGDLHALDKAVWISTVLQEVAFDLPKGVIRALFIDDTVQEWPLMDQSCLAILHGILKDVNLSTMDESHKDKVVERPIEPVTPPPTPTTPTAPATLTKSGKHKKQKSLFASLVALVSSSSSSSARSSSPPPPPQLPTQPPPYTPGAPSRPPSPSSSSTDLSLTQRDLRRRARISLLDVYRRFVINELKERLHPYGYSAWIVTSMLRRASDEMTYMVDQAGGVVPDLRSYLPFPTMDGEAGIYRDHDPYEFFESQTQVDEACLFECDDEVEDEGDGRSLSTETDGSSVHTPLDTPRSWRREDSFSSWNYQSEVDHNSSPSFYSAPPRSPSPPAFSPQDIEKYVSLSRQSLHLRRLLVHMEVMRKNVDIETKSALTVLEVKSKRRAWSNRRLQGGSDMKHIGLAQPFRSSPLVLYEPIGEAGMTNSQIARANKERKYPSAAELFPRMSSPPNEEGSVLSGVSGTGLEIPQPRARLRTKSIEHLKKLDQQDMDVDIREPILPGPHPHLIPVSVSPPPLTPMHSGSRSKSPSPPPPAAPIAPKLVVAPVPQKPERQMMLEQDSRKGTVVGVLDDLERDLEAGLVLGERSGRYERDEWLPGIVIGDR